MTRHIAAAVVLLAAAAAVATLARGADAQVLVSLQYASNDCSGSPVSATAVAVNVCFSSPLLSQMTVCSGSTYTSGAYQGGSCATPVHALSHTGTLNQCAMVTGGGSSKFVCDGSADAMLRSAVWTDARYGTTITATCADTMYQADYQLATCETPGEFGNPSSGYTCSQSAGAVTSLYMVGGCTGTVSASTYSTVGSCSGGQQTLCGYTAVAPGPGASSVVGAAVGAVFGVLALAAVVIVVVCCVRVRRRRAAAGLAAAVSLDASGGNTPYVQLGAGAAAAGAGRGLQQPLGGARPGASGSYAAPVVVERQ